MYYRLFNMLRAQLIANLLVLLALCSPVFAVEVVQPIDIKAMLLGDDVPQLYYFENGEYLPFLVGRNAPGGSNLLAAGSKELSLYREQQADEGKVMVKTSSLPLPEAHALYLIMNYDEQGGTSVKIIENSLSLHPPGYLRFVNTTSDNVVFLLNGEVHPIIAGADQNFSVTSSDGLLTFSYAMKSEGGFKRIIPNKMLRLRGTDSRIMMILTYRRYTNEGEAVQWKPHLTRVYSTVPK
jgi:hypothetical protein